MRYSKALGGWAMASAAVLIAGWGAGCAKKTETAAVAPAASADKVELVAKAERSEHFAAVTEKLELGGTLYGYVDIDGDVLKLATGLQSLATEATASQPMAAAFVPKDFAPFFVDLGLTDVKALGLSSVAVEGGGFRNRAFLYTPEGRRGFLAGLGGPAAEFAVTKFAPADADLVYETELDAPATYAAIRAVVARAAGEPMAAFLDAKLKAPEGDVPFSGMDLIEGMKGRFSLVLRIDETRTFSPTPDVTIPVFDLAIRQEHGGQRLLAAIDGLSAKGVVKREERAGGVIAFVPAKPAPFMDWQPELLIEGDAFTVVTRPSMLAVGGARLADDATFQKALSGLDDKGNGLTYVGPRLASRIGRLAELNPQAPEEQRLVLQRVLAMLPQSGTVLISVRQNLADGVLFKSHWSASHKSSLVFANPGVVVGTGLVAAMAIPAFQKVRASSQEKAVLNNLRQLDAASQQYFLETAKSSCTYADLVGPERGKYIRRLEPVAGEDYTGMVFSEEQTSLSVELENGRVVELKR